MSQLWEYIKIALMNIKSNRGRSILTMLGIIIGIASVIMVISIGSGVSDEMNTELNAMAGGQVYLYVNSNTNDQNIAMNEEDFEAIQDKVDHVVGVTPDYTWYGGMVSGQKGNFDAFVEAGNQNLEYIYKRDIIKGKYFTAADNDAANRVCVISESGARKLFGTTNVIGMTINLTLYDVTQELRIVGVRADDTAALLNTSNGDVSIELPINMLSAAYGFYLEDFNSVMIISEGNEYCSQVAADAIRVVETRHNIRGENLIQVQSFAEQMDEINSMMSMVTLFVVFVAAISLLVGGIGVMNIMLVSVTERTREIGLKKALGARKSVILMQFLTEAAVLTSMGGIIGVGAGVGLAYLISDVASVPVAISGAAIAISVIFSMVIGIVFGFIPSVKASNLNPIDALRYE